MVMTAMIKISSILKLRNKTRIFFKNFALHEFPIGVHKYLPSITGNKYVHNVAMSSSLNTLSSIS